MLEINPGGLELGNHPSKAGSFRLAYDGFEIHRVAAYADEDINRLLSSPEIIRNRLKINAAIHNAQQIQGIQEKFGSFKAWLDLFHPQSKADWVQLFKKNFKFTGGEIVGEFLMSCGYLPGATTTTARRFWRSTGQEVLSAASELEIDHGT